MLYKFPPADANVWVVHRINLANVADQAWRLHMGQLLCWWLEGWENGWDTQASRSHFQWTLREGPASFRSALA